MRSCLVSV